MSTKDKVWASISFRAYANICIPLDLAHKIQLLIAEHGQGYRERYCSREGSYIRMFTETPIPEIALMQKANTVVDARSLSGEPLERYTTTVFQPFVDSTDPDALLMSPEVWAKLATTKGE